MDQTTCRTSIIGMNTSFSINFGYSLLVWVKFVLQRRIEKKSVNGHKLAVMEKAKGWKKRGKGEGAE